MSFVPPAGDERMPADFQVERVLDARGTFCPVPVIMTRYAIDALAPGQVLCVFADDPAAEEDLRRWAKRTGHELLALRRAGRDLSFLFRKAPKR